MQYKMIMKLKGKGKVWVDINLLNQEDEKDV